MVKNENALRTNGQSVDFASASMPLSAERGVGCQINGGNMSALADVAAAQHTRWSLHKEEGKCKKKLPIRMFPHFDNAMARKAGPSV